MSRPRYLVPFLVAVHACTFLLLGVHGLKRQEWSNPDRLVLGLPSERKATGVGVDGILFIVGGTNTASEFAMPLSRDNAPDLLVLRLQVARSMRFVTIQKKMNGQTCLGRWSGMCRQPSADTR